MIVVLMGYMGSGKSTVGRELATLLKYSFIDLDEYISEKENASISVLFEKKGEIYFRKKESQYLNDILNTAKDVVLSLGGGTPCYGNNINLMLGKEHLKLFYLKLSIPVLVQRLLKEKDARPMINHIASKEELIEFIGKHLFERSYYYNKANYIIKGDEKSKKDIAEEIVMRLI